MNRIRVTECRIYVLHRRRASVEESLFTWQSYQVYYCKSSTYYSKRNDHNQRYCKETLTERRGEAVSVNEGETHANREQSSESKRKGFLKEKAMSSPQQTHLYTLSDARSRSPKTFCNYCTPAIQKLSTNTIRKRYVANMQR